MLVQKIDRIINAALLNEYVPTGWRTHVFVMRVTGVWPTPNDSGSYKWLTMAFFFCVGILNPLLQFFNFFFVMSIQDAMDFSFLTLTCIATSCKVAIIYWQRHHIRELHRIHADLLRRAEHNDRVAHINYDLHMFTGLVYILCWFGFLVQCAIAEPDARMWLSTSRWPYEFARCRAVYFSVMVFQAASNLFMVIWCGTADSFYMALMNTACGHLADLKKRLLELGTDPEDGGERDSWFYGDLVDCCMRYEDVLRCEHELRLCLNYSNCSKSRSR